MFEKFGEFDSYEELNRAAAAQKAEGDEEALIALALENGIDREDAEDYMNGRTEELCTATMAALGKLRLEEKEYALTGELQLLADELKVWITNTDTPEEKKLALALSEGIRRKGKDLCGYLAAIIDEGWKRASKPDKRIVERTKIVPSHVKPHFTTGMPDKRARDKIMREYYLGEKVSG